MKKQLTVLCSDEASVSIQQMPDELKACIKAPEGHSFISLDAKAAEIRVYANLSGDRNFQSIFDDPTADCYKVMASKIWNVPVETITPEQRKKAKTFLIANQYGMGAASAAKLLGVSEQEVYQLKDAWNSAFPQAAAFRERCVQQTIATGQSPAFFGRTRVWADKSKAEGSKGFSTLIQGTQAELCSAAMVMVDRYLKDKNWSSDTSLVANIHDEILIQVPDDKIDEAKRDILPLMQQAYQVGQKDGAKYAFEINSGKDWLAASK